MKKRVIWSNIDIDFDQWKEDLIEARSNDWLASMENISDDEVWNWAHHMLDQYLEDEIMNLNVETEGRILAIADLGLWDGRRCGYRILGTNVNNIFNIREDYSEYYSDGHNIKAICTHHDGTNYIEYRVIREDRNIDNLLNDIYNGKEITRKKLNYYTKSLHSYVAKVYGW